MRTAKEIVEEKCKGEWTFLFPIIDQVIEAMKEYAEQTIEECVKQATISTGEEGIDDEDGTIVSYFEINEDSILKVKKLLK